MSVLRLADTRLRAVRCYLSISTKQVMISTVLHTSLSVVSSVRADRMNIAYSDIYGAKPLHLCVEVTCHNHDGLA